MNDTLSPPNASDTRSRHIIPIEGNVEMTMEAKIVTTALSYVCWYDFVGTEFSKEQYFAECRDLDAVFQYYKDANAITMTQTNAPCGLEFIRYYFYPEIAAAILAEYGIEDDPHAFVMMAHYVTFDHGTIEGNAIHALYTRNVADKIALLRQEAPVPAFISQQQSFDPTHR